MTGSSDVCSSDLRPHRCQAKSHPDKRGGRGRTAPDGRKAGAQDRPAGDLLVEFDKELLEKEGYDTTVMFIVSDPSKNVKVHEGRKTAVKDCAFEII